MILPINMDDYDSKFIMVFVQVLWPYLLEFLIPLQYTESFGAVCKNLAVLGEKKKEAGDADFLIDYEDEREYNEFINYSHFSKPIHIATHVI